MAEPPTLKASLDRSITVGSCYVMMKGCPAQHCPLLGLEKSGHLSRDEPMGGRRDSLPCVSKCAFKGHLRGRLWLTARKREAQGS